MKDKGKYFSVNFESLRERLGEVATDERKLYSVSNNELTLFYTLIMAPKEENQ
jgi:hypothetical protein